MEALWARWRGVGGLEVWMGGGPGDLGPVRGRELEAGAVGVGASLAGQALPRTTGSLSYRLIQRMHT